MSAVASPSHGSKFLPTKLQVAGSVIPLSPVNGWQKGLRNSPAPITIPHILLIMMSLVSTQLRNLVTISPTGETRPPPCTPHGANNSNAICGTIKSGWRRSLFVCCKMSLDSIWVLTVDSRHKVPHSDSLTMGQFYCIPSPPFEISTEGERIMNTTTKITTEVTLVLFSLRVVTRAQNIYTVFTKLAWGNSIFYPANIYV